MTKLMNGRLVELDRSGVGLASVPDCNELVYFKLRKIRDYRGETVRELQSGPRAWAAGAPVRIAADVTANGRVRDVEWIELSAS